ncbi:homocitrate synthase [Pectinatus frisingensis]|uniref:homocitrate synthase n=1 Tax=Pectinatus frisingensis TaxID=865 RepID=UPI0015F5448F|nr:homocitrate synthase [Pectinatus frisingensis]
MQKKKFHIVDTTLRDGAQSPLVMFDSREKIAIAEMLDDKNIYQIEAGIPIMGKDELAIISKIKKSCFHAKISTWNRLNKNDLIAAADCEADIVHISVPVSQRQIYEKLQKDVKWLLAQLEDVLAFAASYFTEITIGMEDASRADMKLMLTVIEKVKQFAVKRVRFADTVGIMTPSAVYEQIREIKEKTAIQIEFHAHNDLGMAVANSIAAVQAGADFIDTTVQGIGERCGNCDMEKFLSAAAIIFGSDNRRGLM